MSPKEETTTMISGYDARQNQRKMIKPRDEDVSPKYDIMQIGRMVACVHNGDNDMGPLIAIQ